jgi:hypothetical protein
MVSTKLPIMKMAGAVPDRPYENPFAHEEGSLAVHAVI